MGGEDRHSPKTGVRDEVGMRSRASGYLTEVSWHVEFSFMFFSVLLTTLGHAGERETQDKLLVLFL